MAVVSLGLDSTMLVVVFVTPVQDWIFARSFSRLEVSSVRILRRWVPSPVIAWHSRMPSCAAT